MTAEPMLAVATMTTIESMSVMVVVAPLLVATTTMIATCSDCNSIVACNGCSNVAMAGIDWTPKVMVPSPQRPVMQKHDIGRTTQVPYRVDHKDATEA